MDHATAPGDPTSRTVLFSKIAKRNTCINCILRLFLKDIKEKRIRPNTPAFPTDSQRKSEQKILEIVITCEQRTNFIISYHIPFKYKNLRTNKGYDNNCIEFASSRASLRSLQQTAITKVVRSVYTCSNATESSGYLLRINRKVANFITKKRLIIFSDSVSVGCFELMYVTRYTFYGVLAKSKSKNPFTL